ncbi:MAG: 16S rRNA (adenine(1518)-N(6)/adenine(1519)-N(6))-dimethyltransferase RsmA [Thermofilaceae archaeon]|nr:16S rRNA (adenine(1518)-N(6)/adenine(1519)-N(6))-dimethyltransferase RsmA [Thermofilaceae archaeon]MDW8003361.1 16S rRNA (adenine(1518)-N(6)/adenine(1519)-N(6))-dimethyltransferase RsmA [Thermofilaceae archaeon]
MSLLRECRELLKRHGVKPLKRLGQNFLVSKRALETIVNALDPEPGETVYEIGAGLGTLTSEVARKGAIVFAVEVDPRLTSLLRKRFKGNPLVDVVLGDALQLPVPHVSKIVSNVPYSISSKLLMKLLREPLYSFALLTLQREFALRLVAQPGSRDYGRLTVAAQLYADIQVVGSLSRRAFYPQPEVDSLIVKLRPRKENLEFFTEVEHLTASLFSQRRKKLMKVLKHVGLDPGFFSPILDLDKRVYELTPAEVLEMVKIIREVHTLR